jgi:STE24 endopeptidase
VLMPAAVRRIWQTTSLGGPLRERLDDVCRLRKCSVRDILIWHTDGTMANAAVVGISRWLRYLLLTDVLVARLSDDEIAAVVRHELAHLRRWHLPLRLAVLLLPVAWWLAVKQAWPGIGPLFESTIVSLGVRPAIVAAFGVPVGMVTYAVVVVGWYSRLLEHDADLDASITDGGQLDAIMATDFCRALLTLCGRARESWFSQWLHPPVAARVEFLQRVIFEPTDAVTFRRRLNSVTLAMAVLYVAAMLVAAL